MQTQFESIFWKLELLRKYWKQGRQMVPSDANWINVLDVWTAEKFWNQGR